MEITTGKQEKCQRIVIYGQEGVGKTTLASQFPNPLFVDTEGGTNHLDVARTPTPTSFGMLLSMVADLTRDNHGYRTVVVDSADWAERLCVAEVCAAHNKAGIEDFGYGKGFVYVTEAFGKLLDALTGLRDSGVHVALTAHSLTRKFELPEEEGTFDRYEMKLTRQTAPLVKEWADMLLFARFKTMVVVDDKTKKAKAHGATRVIQTAHAATWDAKNRAGMPAELPMYFEALSPYLGTGADESRPKPAAPVPVHQPKPQPNQALPTADADMSVAHRKLRDAMAASDVTADQVVAAVENHPKLGKVFPLGMAMEDYPDDFVEGTLLKSWDRVAEAARKH